MARSELRRHTRHPASHKLLLSFIDKSQVNRIVRAKCVDISDSGMQIESAEPIEVRTYISFRDEKSASSGSGSVRYCFRKGVNYRIGVEFSAQRRQDASPDA
jgi:hypothetical protein